MGFYSTHRPLAKVLWGALGVTAIVGIMIPALLPARVSGPGEPWPAERVQELVAETLHERAMTGDLPRTASELEALIRASGLGEKMYHSFARIEEKDPGVLIIHLKGGVKDKESLLYEVLDEGEFRLTIMRY